MDGIKILIPTDFSQQADFAWLLANRFGERAKIEIHFLHVLQLPATVSFDGVGNMIADGEIDLRMYTQLRSLAQEKLNHLSQLHQNVVTHLQIGPLTDTIAEFAEKNKFDLVLMGTKGAKGFKEKISGSETQQVVRYSEVPVLSVTCDRSELSIKNILFIHDFEEKVTHDVSLLKFFQEKFESTIHLLRILKKPDETKRLNIERAMKEFSAQQGLINYKIHFIEDKDVEKGVEHFNQLEEMDILCMGTHKRSGIEHLLKGSITEKLVNHLRKPMITYHLH